MIRSSKRVQPSVKYVIVTSNTVSWLLLPLIDAERKIDSIDDDDDDDDTTFS